MCFRHVKEGNEQFCQLCTILHLPLCCSLLCSSAVLLDSSTEEVNTESFPCPQVWRWSKVSLWGIRAARAPAGDAAPFIEGCCASLLWYATLAKEKQVKKINKKNMWELHHLSQEFRPHWLSCICLTMVMTQHFCEDLRSCSWMLHLCFCCSSWETTLWRNAENLAVIFRVCLFWTFRDG